MWCHDASQEVFFIKVKNVETSITSFETEGTTDSATDHSITHFSRVPLKHACQ